MNNDCKIDYYTKNYYINSSIIIFYVYFYFYFFISIPNIR